MTRYLNAFVSAVALLAIAACHAGHLVEVSGSLGFSSPDQPAAVRQPDAGLVLIDFGQVAVSSSKSLTLAVESTGGTAVTLGSLTSLQSDSEFSLPFSLGTVVRPSPPSQITVTFSPTSLGNKSAAYSLAYTPPVGSAVTIELTGEGVPTGLNVTPNPVDFGNVELNQQQPVLLTITNATDISASLAVSSLGGANSNQFSLGALSSTTLGPGASATLNATFGPLVTGAASASLTITAEFSAGTTNPPTTVNLTGTGVQSWLQVTSPLDFGYVSPGRTLVRSAMLKNAGSFATLHLIAPAPHITSGSPVFALQSPQPVLPLALAPGQTAQIPVAFTPPTLDSYTGTLSLATDDPGSPAPVIQIEGNGGGPQILCLSPLDFGPVPLGHSGSEQTICVNAGTDIPNDPDSGLQIAQASLSTDNKAFVASLTLPDGGLGGPDFSVSLAAGQSAAIEITFRPIDAGIYRGRLLVPSSDLSDADAGITLIGEGLVPGPCSVSLVPMQLSFGEVPSGDTGLLQFEISNTGQNLCVLTGISLDPQSDPAFSLPAGDPGYQLLSFSGDIDNPAALPTSLTVEVQFAPTAEESAAAGKVEVAISNAMPSDQSVSLIATSVAACLTIEPPSYDFGLVGLSPSTRQICFPDAKSFMAQNACSVPVTITVIDVASGVDATPQFALGSALQLPLVVAPGGSEYFQASFIPSDVGAKLGAITVSTSELPNAPFLVTLRGDAETKGSRTDTFTVAPPSKQLDLLWVLDNDDDFNVVSSVASVLPKLINVLDAAGIDYQIAVTSTDTCDSANSDQGYFEPCDHCLSTASASPTFVTPSTSGPAETLSELFAFFDLPPQEALCEHLIGDEHFFDSLAAAFSPALLSGHNSGFIRSGADLAVVVVNGDTEDDKGGGSTSDSVQYLTSLDQITTLLQGLKPDPTMVSVSYINAGGLFGFQPRMQALVQATGGVDIDSNVTAWETMLLDVFPIAAGVSSFHLSSTPVGQIEVHVDGVMTSSWSYDSFLDDIVFSRASPPAPGSIITVTYNVGCP